MVVPCLQNLKISHLKRHYPQYERIPADKTTSRRKAGCQKLYPLLQLLSQWRWACICTDWEALAGPSLRELIQSLHVVAMFYTFFIFLHMPNGSKWIQIASESFQVLVARSDGDGLQQNSFVNAISTPKGGTCLGRISLHHRFIRMLDSSAAEVKSFSPDLFKPCELAAQCVGFLLCYISYKCHACRPLPCAVRADAIIRAAHIQFPSHVQKELFAVKACQLHFGPVGRCNFQQGAWVKYESSRELPNF